MQLLTTRFPIQSPSVKLTALNNRLTIEYLTDNEVLIQSTITQKTRLDVSLTIKAGEFKALSEAIREKPFTITGIDNKAAGEGDKITFLIEDKVINVPYETLGDPQRFRALKSTIAPSRELMEMARLAGEGGVLEISETDSGNKVVVRDEQFNVFTLDYKLFESNQSLGEPKSFYVPASLALLFSAEDGLHFNIEVLSRNYVRLSLGGLALIVPQPDKLEAETDFFRDEEEEVPIPLTEKIVEVLISNLESAKELGYKAVTLALSKGGELLAIFQDCDCLIATGLPKPDDDRLIALSIQNLLSALKLAATRIAVGVIYFPIYTTRFLTIVVGGYVIQLGLFQRFKSTVENLKRSIASI